MSELNEVSNVIANKITDVDLVFIAGLANKLDLGIGLTLFVKGSVISGKTIPGSAYYNHLISSLEEYQDSSKVGVFADFLKEAEDSFTIDKIEEMEDFEFIHLMDVSTKNGDGSFSSINGGPIRLKIQEIDGYILGMH